MLERLRRMLSRVSPLRYQVYSLPTAFQPENLEEYVKEGYNTNPTVYSIINYISRNASRVPLRLYKVTDEKALKRVKAYDPFSIEGNKIRKKALEEIDDHPLVEILEQPNPYMGQSLFIEQAVGYKLITGNTYIHGLAPDGGMDSGKFVQLYLLPSQHMEIEEQDGDLVYALVNALSAGEYFGPNKNADFFEEEELKKTHHTFVTNGHVFKHHQNKDPKKKLGDILFSHYNPRMHRVELVITLDKKIPGNEKYINRLLKGDLLATSMGSRVKYDTCSICGNKAKTRAQYCDHMRTMRNKIMPDGKRVYVKNPKPNFFDISLVLIPADKTSSVMDTVAKGEKIVLAEEKKSEMVKRIPMQDTIIDPDPKGLIKKTQKPFTRDKIKKIAQYPMNEIMSTFIGLRILPTKEDFQKIQPSLDDDVY